MLAAIKTAKQLGLGADDVVISVATDGSELYESEKAARLAVTTQWVRRSGRGADRRPAPAWAPTPSTSKSSMPRAETACSTSGYYTWVEQQGVSVEDFDARRDQAFWDELHTMAPGWDAMIDDFNAATGVTV